MIISLDTTNHFLMLIQKKLLAEYFSLLNLIKLIFLINPKIIQICIKFYKIKKN